MSSGPFLSAEWRNLLMLNYEVPRTEIAPYVPPGTEIDDWQGQVLASVVVFQFRNTRVLGLPVPFHRNFEEMNLRFYVRRTVHTELRRGVVFLREVVPLPLVAIVARLSYNEPYRTLPMSSRTSADPAPAVDYRWRAAGRWQSCVAHAEGLGAVPPTGSLEEFVAEHYWGYGTRRTGQGLEYRVAHPPWKVWPVASFTVDADFATVFGTRLGGMLGVPRSVFIADGSAVTVSSPLPLTEGL